MEQMHNPEVSDEVRKLMFEAIMSEPQAFNESGFGRLCRIFHGQVDAVDSVGIFTAENPQGKTLPAEENKKLMDKMKKELRVGNLGFVKIAGNFEGNSEHVFVVMNISRHYTIECGKRYNQKSVIWGRKQDDKYLSFKFEYIEGDRTIQTREIILSGEEISSRDDDYSKAEGRKFVIPFFDTTARSAQSVRGKIINRAGRAIDEKSYKEIVERVSGCHKTGGFSSWGNKGILLEILKKTNCCLYDN